jgi:hypothetical protein
LASYVPQGVLTCAESLVEKKMVEKMMVQIEIFVLINDAWF